MGIFLWSSLREPDWAPGGKTYKSTHHLALLELILRLVHTKLPGIGWLQLSFPTLVIILVMVYSCGSIPFVKLWFFVATCLSKLGGSGLPHNSTSLMDRSQSKYWHDTIHRYYWDVPSFTCVNLCVCLVWCNFIICVGLRILYHRQALKQFHHHHDPSYYCFITLPTSLQLTFSPLSQPLPCL